MRPIIIDHDDSFTHILAHYIGELCRRNMPLILHHKKNTLQEVIELEPTHLILSPGPGTVENEADFAIGHQLIDHFEKQIPILGVCLGHQGIAAHYGAKIVHAPKVMHGKKDQIIHNNAGLFKDLENPLTVMRYHSLCIDPNTLPDCLEVTAQSSDGTIMGIQHKNLPIHGVQFHPESIGTATGSAILKAFL